MGHIAPLELLRVLQTLPSDKQTEVADFVLFLAARCTPATDGASPQNAWTDEEFSTFAMQHAQQGLADESVLYSAADLKDHWL